MPRVTELFAFVIEDRGPEDEGVPAILTDRGMLPLMGADWEREEGLRPHAQRLATQFGKPIRLLRFRGLEEVEVLLPEGENK